MNQQAAEPTPQQFMSLLPLSTTTTTMQAHPVVVEDDTKHIRHFNSNGDSNITMQTCSPYKATMSKNLSQQTTAKIWNSKRG
jgi:hypothetical protein